MVFSYFSRRLLLFTIEIEFSTGRRGPLIVYQDAHIDCSFSFEIEDFQRVLRGSFIVYQNSDILPFIKIFRRGGGAFIIS